MKFGNFLLTYQPPQFSQTEVMKRLVKLGRISEECGFDTVWLLEHHFTEFGLLGNRVHLLVIMFLKCTLMKISKINLKK